MFGSCTFVGAFLNSNEGEFQVLCSLMLCFSVRATTCSDFKQYYIFYGLQECFFLFFMVYKSVFLFSMVTSGQISSLFYTRLTR